MPAPTITLNDGNVMPQLGLGVWQSPADITAEVVRTALAAGYRSIDTAAIYRNEAAVGEGVRASGLARDEIFVTTKLWNDEQGYDSALRGFESSLKRLGLDYVDLYLIHWPAPGQGRYLDTWRALLRLREEGRARSVGVSNFMPEHLRRIVGETGEAPALNQVELHPRFQQTDLRSVHASLGIATEAWSPLGQGRLLEDPVVRQAAEKHGRTAAQVIIRWHLDNGLIVIPKSVNETRIRANFDVFDFQLDEEDLRAFAALDSPVGRIGPDPVSFG
ncbi:aldo/keto reductase [Phenylobacterium sp.]|uniref:aldo/keto reductase n=1 Tax=Phenylobacterium sp. TaxID=1871053 RepID=UPI002F95A8F7